MPVEFLFEDLPNLVEYEIGKIRRMVPFGKLSVLYFHTKNETDRDRIHNLLKNVLRESDAIIIKDNNFFLVLPLTDKEGAEFVYEGIKGFFEKEFPKVIACYPGDADNARDLLNKILSNAKSEYDYLESFFMQDRF